MKKKEICDLYKKGVRHQEITEKYKIARSTFYDIVSDEKKFVSTDLMGARKSLKSSV